MALGMATPTVEELEAENEILRAALHRLHDWSSASPDWRPDAKLGRDVRAALDHGLPTADDVRGVLSPR